MDDVRFNAVPNPVKPCLPNVGAVIADHTILEQIGMGGFGAVYRALHRRLNREVALKILKPSEEFASDLPQRFTREINLTVRLEHPNIVRVYDCGADQATGLLWMSMEYVRGGTLSELLKESIQFDFPRARRICMQLLSGLVSAHEQLIVHRDLKPGNIMLMRSGAEDDFVKILDFGIAKAVGEGENQAVQNLTETGRASFGTPRYMAPEQIFNKQIGPWTDVYSVGLILYEMLVGRPAIDGDSAFEVLANQVTKPVELPTKLLLSEIGPVLNRAISKEVSTRFQSAKDFYEALRALRADAAMGDNVSGPTPLVGTHGDDGNRTVRSDQIPIEALELVLPRPAASIPKRFNPLAVVIVVLLLLLLGLGIFAIARSTAPASIDNAAPAQAPRPEAEKPPPIADAAPIWPEPALTQATQPSDAAPVAEPPTALLLRIESSPTQARVLENGVLLGLTPLELRLERDSLNDAGRTFALEKDGHLPASLVQTQTEQSELDVRVELQKVRKPKKPDQKPATDDDPGLRPR